MQAELEQGLRMMIYVCNHPWKFRFASIAFIIGLTQMCMVLFVETINVFILCANSTIMDIIMNFLALVVIADFDNMFAVTLKGDPIYEMLDSGEIDDAMKERMGFLKQTTTSAKACQKIAKNKLVKDFDQEPVTINDDHEEHEEAHKR